jgi:ligand-binding sensor domain-containing protein
LLQNQCRSAHILIFLRKIVRLVSKQSLLFCSGIALLMAVHVAAQSPLLERLGAAEGLSQGMIFDLLQDRNGFLWFATKDGLNRYDGYSFQVFQNDPFDRFSIPDNEIQVLLEDSQGRIWAGTANNGLAVLEPSNGRFYRINTLSSQSVYSLAQTLDGAIWAGCGSNTNRIQVPDVLPADNPSLDAIAKVEAFSWHAKPNPALPALTRSVDLQCDQAGRLWVSTYQQIGYYDTKSGLFEKVWTNPLPEGNNLTSSFFQKARMAPCG